MALYSVGTGFASQLMCTHCGEALFTQFKRCSMGPEPSEGKGVRNQGCGGMASQLDLLSLMQFSIAGWGRLQLGVTHCSTSVVLL